MVQLNGVALAYIGDAVYEVFIRKTLIDRGLTKVDRLHKEAIKYTSAKGQIIALEKIFEGLSEEEVNVFKRGRNSNSGRKPKNTELSVYKQATGFEALIGYLYISEKKERLETILNIIIK